ncbi:gas vesicle protein GvpO [Streptomyces lydicus]|uniref:gas vesicle protein GvpO n=1 Tax=Streptomyces lydicus TaxID=47763 RepID=UPI0038039DBE
MRVVNGDCLPCSGKTRKIAALRAMHTFELLGHAVFYRRNGQPDPVHRTGVPASLRRPMDGIMATTESTEGKRGPQRIGAPAAMRHVAGQLAQLLGCEPGAVSALKATDEGWSADVEVVEIERIPDTASVMASYRVQLDAQGELLGYERIRRYARGQIDR